MSRRLAAASIAATLALALAPAVAAQGPERGVTVVEKRVALVIGNGGYSAAPLRNPVNDARAMAQTLRGLGFDVVARENLGQNEMRRAILDFGRRLLDGGVGLFYFAGHGMQVGGRNFLIPIAAEARSEDEVEVEAVDVAYVLARMSTARNRLNIVILDACRDNPFARAFRTSARGLASIDAPTGTIIAYATAPGKTARDGEGTNGLYTGELVKVMTAPGLKIEEVFKRVRQSVQQRTGGDQVPWEASSLVGDFVFVLPAVAARPAPAPAAPPPAVAAVPPGGVRIESSPPGAEVYWDARPAGKTPLALPSAAPGRHQLVLVLEGYATVIEDVEVTAGQPLVVAKRLEEQAGPQAPPREPTSGEAGVASPSRPAPQAALPVPRIGVPPGGRAKYPLIAVAFVGLGSDRVGRGFMSRPNGEPDGQFRLVIDPGDDRILVIGIEVYTSDARGRPGFGIAPEQRWTTTGPGWFLGVERNAQRLNPSDRTIREAIREPVAYDLYADAKDWFVPGQHFTVVVSFGDGTKRMKVVQVP